MKKPGHRKLILDKLGWVCAKMEADMAGQKLNLADIPLPQDADPGETPLERLRKFKALLQETLERFDAGKPATCRVCGGPIPPVELDAMPWANTCRACH